MSAIGIYCGVCVCQMPIATEGPFLVMAHALTQEP